MASSIRTQQPTAMPAATITTTTATTTAAEVALPRPRRRCRPNLPARSVGYIPSTSTPRDHKRRSRAHSRSIRRPPPTQSATNLNSSDASSTRSSGDLPPPPNPKHIAPSLSSSHVASAGAGGDYPELESVTEPEVEAEPEVPRCILADVDTDGERERLRPAVSVHGQPQCAVDGELFRVGDSVARLPCGHVFHKSCILPFLLHCHGIGYCPIDGTPVPRELVTKLPVWSVVHSAEFGSPEKKAQTAARPLVHVEAPQLVPSPPPQPRESEVTIKQWTPQFRETCPIDGERFKQGELCLKIKPCAHHFHARCLAPYIAHEQCLRCPIDGHQFDASDVRTVVAATVSTRPNASVRFNRRPEPKLHDARVRRAMRALGKVADAACDLASQEERADAHTRFALASEREASVRRREAALHLKDVALVEPARGISCVVDGESLRFDERVVMLECGHIFHEQCAKVGALCTCRGAAKSPHTAGRLFELMPTILRTQDARWRCSEMAVLAQERAEIRRLDAAGDGRAAVAVADKAMHELREALRKRRALAASNYRRVSTSARELPPFRSLRASLDNQAYNRRRSLPDNISAPMRTKSAGTGSTTSGSDGAFFRFRPRTAKDAELSSEESAAAAVAASTPRKLRTPAHTAGGFFGLRGRSLRNVNDVTSESALHPSTTTPKMSVRHGNGRFFMRSRAAREAGEVMSEGAIPTAPSTTNSTPLKAPRVEDDGALFPVLRNKRQPVELISEGSEGGAAAVVRPSARGDRQEKILMGRTQTKRRSLYGGTFARTLTEIAPATDGDEGAGAGADNLLATRALSFEGRLRHRRGATRQTEQLCATD